MTRLRWAPLSPLLLALLPGCLLVTELDYEAASGGGGATSSPSSTGSLGAASPGGGSPSSSVGEGPSTGGGSSVGGGSSAGGGTAAGGGTSSGGGGAGGEGGADPCADLDLETDPDNCGTCGFACASGACDAGRCDESIDLAAQGVLLRAVLVSQDRLFLMICDNAAPDYAGTVLTLPLDFGPDTEPVAIGNVENCVGSFVGGSVGTHRVYFAGQVDENVHACSTEECVATDLDAQIDPQINGMAAVGTTLYLLESAGGSRVVSVPLDEDTGIPGSTVTPLVTSYTDMAPAGPLGLAHDPNTDALFWSGYDDAAPDEGCIYRAAIDDLPLDGPATCWSPPFQTQGFVLGPDGTVYAQDGATTLLELTGDPPTRSVFDASATGPRDVDADTIYVQNPGTAAIRALPLDGGEELGSSDPAPVFVYTMEASHPDYVFYTAGTVLYRWPKPGR